jgi:hypothetical protein
LDILIDSAAVLQAEAEIVPPTRMARVC